MSRVGKHPVTIPVGVQVILNGNEIEVKGPKGVLKKVFHNDVNINFENNEVIVSPKFKTNSSRALWGTTRRVINNMVIGVTQGFTKVLDINGVGFKAALLSQGNTLRLTLGFSHEILYIPMDGIALKCSKPTQIEVMGIDNQIVGQTAAEIRAFKKPEPYKGKGIKYSYEVVLRKDGKKK